MLGTCHSLAEVVHNSLMHSCKNTNKFITQFNTTEKNMHDGLSKDLKSTDAINQIKEKKLKDIKIKNLLAKDAQNLDFHEPIFQTMQDI